MKIKPEDYEEVYGSYTAGFVKHKFAPFMICVAIVGIVIISIVYLLKIFYMETILNSIEVTVLLLSIIFVLDKIIILLLYLNNRKLKRQIKK